MGRWMKVLNYDLVPYCEGGFIVPEHESLEYWAAANPVGFKRLLDRMAAAWTAYQAGQAVGSIEQTVMPLGQETDLLQRKPLA